MPKLVIPLTDVQVRNAKPKEKAYKLSDGSDLYLKIMPTGSKLWCMSIPDLRGALKPCVKGNHAAITSD